mgnify:CR=1 FL=1
MMRELMNVIKGSKYLNIGCIDWSKVVALGFPSIEGKYLVDIDDLTEVIDNAIENNTMSLEDIAKLEKVLTLMEVML